MNTQGVKRKHTAILSADVVGYSRLMGFDDAATVHTLGEYRLDKFLIDPYTPHLSKDRSR